VLTSLLKLAVTPRLYLRVWRWHVIMVLSCCIFISENYSIGVYVIVGQYTDNGSIDINPHLDINKKHLDIRYLNTFDIHIIYSHFHNRGCWGCDFSHLYLAIQMMGKTAQTVPWTKMITAKYSLKVYCSHLIWGTHSKQSSELHDGTPRRGGTESYQGSNRPTKEGLKTCNNRAWNAPLLPDCCLFDNS